MGPKNFVLSKQMYDALVEKTKLLENRVNVLEDKNAVLETVNSKLQKELDRLDQYGRRSNIIIRNIEVPEAETQEDIEKKDNI